MALNKPTQTDFGGSECQSAETEPEDLEELESEVKQMAQKILEYRATLPDQLKKTLASVLAVQRPVLPNTESASEPGTSGQSNSDAGVNVESCKRTLLVEEDKDAAEKIHLLRLKISSNVSSMPILLKRMNDCISKIDNLDLHNGIIHPAFKKKRTS